VTEFKVANKDVDGSRITYTIHDDSDALVGRAIISFYQKKSFWRYTGTNGLLISDKGIRRKMDRAIKSHNGDD
jgi:hypothetical protein